MRPPRFGEAQARIGFLGQVVQVDQAIAAGDPRLRVTALALKSTSNGPSPDGLANTFRQTRAEFSSVSGGQPGISSPVRATTSLAPGVRRLDHFHTRRITRSAGLVVARCHSIVANGLYPAH